jgi:hypothetical protein
MDEKSLEALFDKHLADPTGGSNVVDLELRKVVAALGKSVLALNKSSTRLAVVNISLAGVMAAAGVVQVLLFIFRR